MKRTLKWKCVLYLLAAALLVVQQPLRSQEKPLTTSTPPSAASKGLLNDWLKDESSFFSPWNLGGQFRGRFEHAEYLDAPGASGIDTGHGPVDFRAAGGDAHNDHFLLRELLHLGYTPVSWLNFYVEGRDSSSFDDDRNPSPDSDSIDLHQAFIRLGDAKRFPLLLKVGRQELVYGDERLIGASDWTNVKRAFDAVKLRYEIESLWLDAFVSRPVIVWDDHFNESNDYDYFSGLYASSTNLISFQESQLYVLSRNTGLQSPHFYGLSPLPQGASPRDIYTIGARFKSLPGQLGGWDYCAEIAGQGGRFKETTKGAPASVAGKNLEQQAYAVAVGGGYTFTTVPATPRLGLEYVYSSGDSNPTDGRHETFDNLFPTNHKFYGILDLFSWQNVQNVHLCAAIKPFKGFTLTADYRIYWLADSHDSFYTNKGARRGGLTPTNGSGYGINSSYDSFLGSEIDLVGAYALKRYAQFQAGVGHYFVGDYVKSSLSAVGGAKDGEFVYAQLVFNF